MWHRVFVDVMYNSIALKVAKEEHSNVLLANALHHRSDAAGSLVALGAIVCSSFHFTEF